MEALQVILNNECKNELLRLGYRFGFGNNILCDGNIPVLTNCCESKIIGGKLWLDHRNTYTEFELYQQYLRVTTPKTDEELCNS